MSGVRAPAPPGWDIGPERRIDDGKTLATGLAWFSIGLGLTELVAAERLCEYLGIKGREDLVRLMGLREVATGVGILGQWRRPTPWIVGRIAGDVLDLAILGSALPDNRKRHRVLATMGAVAGAMALDVLCQRQLASPRS